MDLDVVIANLTKLCQHQPWPSSTIRHQEVLGSLWKWEGLSSKKQHYAVLVNSCYLLNVACRFVINQSVGPSTVPSQPQSRNGQSSVNDTASQGVMSRLSYPPQPSCMSVTRFLYAMADVPSAKNFSSVRGRCVRPGTVRPPTLVIDQFS